MLLAYHAYGLRMLLITMIYFAIYSSSTVSFLVIADHTFGRHMLKITNVFLGVVHVNRASKDFFTTH